VVGVSAHRRRIEGDVTGALGLTDEEWNILVRVPRWVVGAASAAHVDSAAKTRQEIENGFISVANGRKLGNPIVSDIAGTTLKIFDQDVKQSGVDPSTEAGRDAIIEHAKAAWNVLRAKATPIDAAAYRRFLLNVCDDVITAVRADEHLGFGGVLIHPDEQRFRDRLSAAMH
jgi:hypothetical protein